MAFYFIITKSDSKQRLLGPSHVSSSLYQEVPAHMTLKQGLLLIHFTIQTLALLVLTCDPVAFAYSLCLSYLLLSVSTMSFWCCALVTRGRAGHHTLLVSAEWQTFLGL